MTPASTLTADQREARDRLRRTQDESGIPLSTLLLGDDDLTADDRAAIAESVCVGAGEDYR